MSGSRPTSSLTVDVSRSLTALPSSSTSPSSPTSPNSPISPDSPSSSFPYSPTISSSGESIPTFIANPIPPPPSTSTSISNNGVLLVNSTSPSNSSSTMSQISPPISSSISALNASSSTESATTGEDQHLPIPTIIGLSVAITLLIVGGIVGFCWIKHRRNKRGRIEARDLREKGVMEGSRGFNQWPFDHSRNNREFEIDGGGSDDGNENRLTVDDLERVIEASNIPRPSQVRINSQSRINGMDRMGVIQGSSRVREGNSRAGSIWTDDSEFDMIATDGSSTIRTLRSTSSSSSFTSLPGISNSDIDHPSYTYQSQPSQHIGNTSQQSHTYISTASILPTSRRSNPSPSLTFGPSATSSSSQTTPIDRQGMPISYRTSQQFSNLNVISSSSQGDHGRRPVSISESTTSSNPFNDPLPQYTSGLPDGVTSINPFEDIILSPMDSMNAQESERELDLQVSRGFGGELPPAYIR